MDPSSRIEGQPVILTACNDDILRLIVANLDAFRDVVALLSSCKSLYRFTWAEGWRTFVRTRFPWYKLPASEGDHWIKLAQSLRFQTRCWERRAMRFRVFVPDPGFSRGGHDSRRGVPFHAVVDAHFDPDTQEELVVWGAGEDIIGRRRDNQGFHGATQVNWVESPGRDHRYAPGPDDVKAITIVPSPMGHQEKLGMLVGRDNGHLRLLSTQEGSFGSVMASFSPGRSNNQTGTPFEQETINSLDVSYRDQRQGMAVASTKSAVFLYPLPADESHSSVAPSLVIDCKNGAIRAPGRHISVCSATWVGRSIALTAKGPSVNPLNVITITDSGYADITPAAKNLGLQSAHDLKYRNICPRSLQSIRPLSAAQGDTDLLLSAWKDGTVRLQDLRSPSSFDAIYQDNINPTETLESLLVLDGERFIGGSGSDLTVKIFDLRWHRPYHHSSELPCTSQTPIPTSHQPFVDVPPQPTRKRKTCDHLRGRLCRWHELSTQRYYRPNAKIFLVDPFSSRRNSPRRIWSLVRASPITPTFYMGVSGGIVEASLAQVVGVDREGKDVMRSDPNYAFTDWDNDDGEDDNRGQCSYWCRLAPTAMQEIGDGLASPHNSRPIKLPPLLSARDGAIDRSSYNISGAWKARHRLDRPFQQEGDFKGLDFRDFTEDERVERRKITRLVGSITRNMRRQRGFKEDSLSESDDFVEKSDSGSDSEDSYETR